MDSGAWWPWTLTLGAVAGMVVSWWLSRTGWKIFQRTDEPLSARLDELTLEVVDLRLLLSRVMVGTAKLITQLERAGIEPAYRLPDEIGPAAEQAAEESDAAKLHRLLIECFSREELDDLALEAGIEAESYGGATRSARALALVQVASRHGKLAELIAAAGRQRPRVKWPRMGSG